MQKALAVLAKIPPSSRQRVRAVDDAAEATQAYVIQRELLGFRDSEMALSLYRVPGEVRARMGARRRA
jgi:hypothetical protein